MMVSVPNPYFAGKFTTERVLNFDQDGLWVTSDTGPEFYLVSEVTPA